MDPTATLDDAADALANRDHALARELLAAYRAWRARGGFEPPGGDALEKTMRAMLP